MSTVQAPQFQLHHRLSLALEVADITAEDMADNLGVHRNSVYNYVAGRTTPKLGMLKQWALMTGVPVDWILTGDTPDGGTDQLGGTSAWTVLPLFTRADYFDRVAS